jgi:hypothetical protein
VGGRPTLWALLGRRVRGSLSSLALLAILGSFVGLFVYRDRYERKERAEAEEARVAPLRAAFERGALGEVLASCREAWAAELSLHGVPVAVAWSRGAVDAYFYEGTDEASLRQARCTAQGVSRGPRVAHPLAAAMPAEAPGAPPEDVGDEWSRALDAASSRPLGSGELAFEIVRHPVTGRALSRTWRAGPEALSVVRDPPEQPAFALLLAQTEVRLPVGVGIPALERLPRRRWLADPGAAFDLLARELPEGARVSELRLENDGIDVQIAWPTPAFDGEPPAPYGDRAFDEYGVPDMGIWYPRESPGFGCPQGETVERVRESFAKARARLGDPVLLRAWFSCSTAYSNGRDGVWNLVTP